VFVPRRISSRARGRVLAAGERPRGLPHVYRGGSRAQSRGRFDRDQGAGSPGGRFRWLLSTCLAASIGAIAVLVVVYGSSDQSDHRGLMPAIRKMRDGTSDLAFTLRRDEGLKWATPKADKLQMVTGAISTRFIIHETLKVKKASREYLHAKPYARIVARLAPVPGEYADVIPPFNPFKLYATTPTAGSRLDGAPATDVSIKVVELLGGILPGEDGQELDTQEVAELVSRSKEAGIAMPGDASADGPATAPDPVPAYAELAQQRKRAEPVPAFTTLVPKAKGDADDGGSEDLEKRQVRVVKVGRADTLVKILTQAGADAWQAKAMAETAKSVFPEGSLTAGQEVRITMVPSLTQANRNEPARFSVFSDGHEHKVTVTRSGSGEFIASATPFDEQVAAQAAMGESDIAQPQSLYASFYGAGLLQNLPPETIQQMLRIHAYETDFRRRIRGGDMIEMFFDMRDDSTPDGPPGELLFTGIASGGETFRYYRYRTPDGLIDFYDDSGKNAKKFLERRPIRSTDVRLTSGFGMRFHPFYNERRMHSGIDWSGPIGSPILAAGSGTVEEALHKGGNGKYVRIRHANGYQTTYSHMSGFARGIEPGTKVRQGQIIGFLGNTGISTGPHLHFEILVNNRFVDPLSIQVPRERTLSGKLLADFQKERGRIDDLMRRPPVMMLSK
jgi:murein DD-endopeptidase MepM/ murein hydrolase activator NlpD